jgi:glycosyltransferase involved in cell wall biosynthesis
MNLIIQTCVPSYRLNFYKYLVKQNKSIKIISGDKFYSPTVTSDKATPNVIWIKNYFFLKRNFLFQKLPWGKIISSNIIIIEFNLRNLSFYLVFFLRIILFRDIYLWGHAWPRKGKKSKSEIIRYVFKRISKGYITYTLEQKFELEEQLKNKKIFAACNAIYCRNEMEPIKVNSEKVTNFIYVGRLVKDKKVLTVLKAFHRVVIELPKSSKLIIVGSGSEYSNLKKYVNNNKLSDRVHLLGQISNYDDLKELYSTSIASVSPGYVGLSITQSLGFGVPMIISKNENHSPEIEAANKDNSTYFKTDDTENLALILLNFFNKKEEWINKREEISEKCRENYSIEKMTAPFLQIFNR